MRRWTWIVVAMAGAAVALAQSGGRDADSLPVATSLLAGFVTHAEGEVTIDGEKVDTDSGELYQLEDGEHAVTGEGRAEFTLCIGSFLRLGNESELAMVDAGMRSAEVRLVRGELLADVPFLVDEQVSKVWAGELMVELSRPGLYRLRMGGDGPRVDVLRGRAELDWRGAEARVGRGKSWALGTDGPRTGKAEDAEEAELMAWNSKRRKAWKKRSEEEDWDGMSQLDRMMLEMSWRRPRSPPPIQQPPAGGGGGGGSGPRKP